MRSSEAPQNAPSTFQCMLFRQRAQRALHLNAMHTLPHRSGIPVFGAACTQTVQYHHAGALQECTQHPSDCLNIHYSSTSRGFLDVLEGYRRAWFCVQPMGDTPTRSALFDCLASGLVRCLHVPARFACIRALGAAPMRTTPLPASPPAWRTRRRFGLPVAHECLRHAIPPVVFTANPWH